MKKKKITITHQLDKTIHTFSVTNPDSITKEEVSKICEEMNVTALLINGRYYRLQ